MVESCRIRTDLALRRRSALRRKMSKFAEWRCVRIIMKKKDIRTTVVKIRRVRRQGDGAPAGNYITIEAPNLSFRMRIITERSRRRSPVISGS